MAIGGVLVAQNPALAVHDLDFQLDGNVVSTPDGTVGGTTQEFDWADFFNAAGAELPLPAGFDAATFDRDFLLNANGTFDNGDNSTWATGSKDDLAITPGWQCKRDQNLLDKNDIMNAYAASYAPTGGDEVLYFGLERNGNNGAANVGFWFLQDDSVDCESPGGNTPFTGSHVDGDILVVSEFTNGGVVSTIVVYRWNDPDGDGFDPNFGDTFVASGADCRLPGTLLGDDACATVNALLPVATPWLTVDKTTVGRTLDVREFFEGGLNLSETGLGGRCFNTFIATTRASQEIGANLHDFSRGELGGCDSTTVTTPSISSAEIPAHGTLAVTDSATITVTGSNDWDGSVAFFLCRSSELDASGECSTGGTPIGSAVPVTEATTMPVSSATAGLTAVDHYCWRAEFTSTTDGVPDSSDHRTSECFDVTPRQPALTTDATDGPVDFGDPISDTISLTNTADTPGTDGAGPGGTINATNRQPANGTISVTAFGPDDCVTVAHSATIPVSGDNTAYGGPGSSTEFVPAAPGVYTYVASYSGDSPNTLGVPTTACPDLTGAEVVTVRQIPTNMDTAQNFVPNDSATITVTGGGDLAGSVVFKLFVDDATCTAPADYQSDPIDIATGAGTGTSRTVVSGNTTAYSVSGTTFHWVVDYTSTNPAHLGVSSPCGNETSSIIIDNGVTQPPTP